MSFKNHRSKAILYMVDNCKRPTLGNLLRKPPRDAKLVGVALSHIVHFKSTIRINGRYSWGTPLTHETT